MELVQDYRRGCGFRKVGGIYLVAPKLGMMCGRLPIVLGHVCRITLFDIDLQLGTHFSETYMDADEIDLGCGQLVWDKFVDGKVIKQSRSYRKLANPAPLFNAGSCKLYDQEPRYCDPCPMATWPDHEPVLLEWVSKEQYPTANHFEVEAEVLGVSRRVRHLPEWFKVGQTWVVLAHEHVVPLSEEEASEHVQFLPAIFRMFKPVRAEVVCDGTETEEELAEYKAKGLTPVKVQNMGEHPALKAKE